MPKPLTTTKAVAAWLNKNPDHRIVCAKCGADYSWRSIFFMRRHYAAAHGISGADRWVRA